MFKDIPRHVEEMVWRGNPVKSRASPAWAVPLERGLVLTSCSPAAAAVTRSLQAAMADFRYLAFLQCKHHNIDNSQTLELL